MKAFRKRHLLIALLVAALLSGCSQAAPQEPDTQMMNFPGLDWGMTPDEVQTALPLKDPEVLEEPKNAYIGLGGGLDIFGAEDAYVLFRFFDSNGDGRFSLRYITVWFFPGTDHAAVREALVAQYGELEAPELQNSGEWNSEVLCRDVMSEEEIAYIETQNERVQAVLTKPVTSIAWVMSVYPAYTFPDGREAESQLGFSSDAALYLYEGGLTPQLEAEAAP